MNTRYEKIQTKLFKKNREKFCTNLISNSIAIFNSNDIFPLSADSQLPFKQHSDIFYLTGIDQEETILLLFPNAIQEEYKEILFIKETSETIKIWEGEKLSKQQATEISGINTIFWIHQFDAIFCSLVHQVETIYLNLNEHSRASREVETREDRFVKNLMPKFPLHQYKRSQPILHKIRSIKELQEIELISKACKITENGFRRVLKFIKDGVYEYEIEAEFIHEFIKNRSKGFAYSPIIASGKNATVLHYVQNNAICRNGELLLLDVAAEYANYSSDLTRVVPISGRFTKRQKDIYQAVLDIKNFATDLLIEGMLFKNYNEEIGKFVTSKLIEIQLLNKVDIQNEDKKNPAYKKYFMHGTSHFLGLDTHDYGNYHEPLQENMILTVEPGIYIPQEKIGIRLEDNVVIQKNNKPINLMENIPILIEEIEELMNA